MSSIGNTWVCRVRKMIGKRIRYKEEYLKSIWAIGKDLWDREGTIVGYNIYNCDPIVLRVVWDDDPDEIYSILETNVTIEGETNA